MNATAFPQAVIRGNGGEQVNLGDVNSNTGLDYTMWVKKRNCTLTMFADNTDWRESS